MSNGPRYRGKTFHEYMSAKFWHPASKRNIVTVWKRKQQMEVSEFTYIKLSITSINLKKCAVYLPALLMISMLAEAVLSNLSRE